MESWRHERLGALVGALLALGCSVGQGQGEIYGELHAPYCMVDEPDYRMEPSFFSAEVTEQQLDIRVQRGSDIEGYADGLMIHVGDVHEVFRNRIGLPIEVSPDHRALVQAVAYFNETCPSGFPDFFVTQPLVLEGVSGQIVFRAVYAPEIEPGQTEIAAELRSVRFEAAHDPDTYAVLSGAFSFFYQRGSPAQRFP